MAEEIQADELGDISISLTVAKFQLMTYAPANGTSERKLVHSRTVVMPFEAFLRGAAGMRNVLQDLENKGVIARAPKKSGKGGAAKT
jgi:hypothetical protein